MAERSGRARRRSQGPTVSVLVPVRDEGPHLEEALASLAAQTYEDFEAIIVDDGSSDRSHEVARAHAARDRRFRVLRQPPLGIVAALERARRREGGSHGR